MDGVARAPETRCDPSAVRSGDERHRRTDCQGILPKREAVPRSPARRSRPHGTIYRCQGMADDHQYGHGSLRGTVALDRLRQRGQPPAGPRGISRARDRGPSGGRTRPKPHRAPPVEESAIYALLAGALGLLLGSWLLELMAWMFPSLDFAVTDLSQDIRLDSRVAAFTALLSLVTIAIFGLAPAIRASWTAPEPALRGGTRARGTLPGWLSVADLLVALQVALAVVLLVSGGLFWRSLEHAT